MPLLVEPPVPLEVLPPVPLLVEPPVPLEVLPPVPLEVLPPVPLLVEPPSSPGPSSTSLEPLHAPRIAAATNIPSLVVAPRMGFRLRPRACRPQRRLGQGAQPSLPGWRTSLPSSMKMTCSARLVLWSAMRSSHLATDCRSIPRLMALCSRRITSRISENTRS